MEIDFAFLADNAQSENGKVYVLGGGIDTLWAKEMPAHYPHLAFVLRAILDAAEIGRKHKLEIQIMDEDGAIMGNIGGDFEIPQKSPQLPKGWKQAFTTVFNFQNLNFKKFGNYSFNLLIDNFSLKSVSLRVAQRVEAS